MKYTEILKLKAMLEEADIPFVFTDDKFKMKDNEEILKIDVSGIYNKMRLAYQLIINSKKGTRLCDAIEDCFSYGNEEDLLEICGGLTEEESMHDAVIGWLTAEEVFKRFKYCYENNTEVYIKVGDES